MTPSPTKPYSDSIFILFLVLLTFSSTFGQTYFFGVLQPEIRAEYGLSEAGFGRIYLLVTLASAVGVTLIGPVIDRMPLERYVTSICGALILAVLTLAQITPFLFLVLGMMAARMIGQGLMVHAAMTSATRYFTRLRGRAIAFATGGITLGQALIPPLAVMLMADYGWRTTTNILIAGFAAIIMPLIYLCLRGHEARHTAWEEAEKTKAALSDTAKPVVHHLRRHHMMRDWRFYAFIPALTIGPFWTTAMFFFADHLAAMRGMTLADLTPTYSLHALVGFLAPLLGGVLVDKKSALSLVWLSPLAMAFTFIILLETTLPMGFVMAALGFGVWIAIPVNNALWAELYGTRYLGEIKGLANAVLVVSTALSPFIAGELITSGIAFETIVMGGYIHSLIALLAAIPLMMKKPAS